MEFVIKRGSQTKEILAPILDLEIKQPYRLTLVFGSRVAGFEPKQLIQS